MGDPRRGMPGGRVSARRGKEALAGNQDRIAEETEALQVRRLPLSEAIAMVKRGEITDAMSVMALLRLARDRS